MKPKEMLPSTVNQKDQPTIRPDNVDIAKPRDENEIFDLLILLDNENSMFPRSDEKVLQTIQRATYERGGIIGIIRVEKKIVGCVGMFLDQFWNSEAHFLSEYWNMVHPDFRKSDYAKNLIDFAKHCNETLGVLLLMGILSTSRTEAKSRLYGRRLIPCGNLFANGIPSLGGNMVRDMLQDEPEYAAGGH